MSIDQAELAYGPATMRRVSVQALGLGLAACLAALVLTLAIGLAWAQQVIDRAGLAHAQMAAVAGIEAGVSGVALSRQLAPSEEAPRRAALARDIAVYRGLVMDELGGAAPTAEARDAARLVALADQLATVPGGDAVRLNRLHATVARIASRERDELATNDRDMNRLRHRIGWLAVLIAATAAALAGFAGAGLNAVNRRLGREVAVRTAELETKSERLAAIDGARRLFFAELGHELRTPVTVMRGEAEVALRGSSAEAALREALDHVVAQAGFLHRRLDELVDVARSEEGTLDLASAPLDLAVTVRSAGEAAAPFARSNDVTLRVEGADRPVLVIGDARWIEQALLAILDNGVKFSDPGATLVLQLSVEGDYTRIKIADTGIGVEPAALSHLFDPYVQGEAGRARGGSGLGLSLARWIVERHGGRIDAANRAGGGCVVTIDLPVAA